MKPPTGLGKGRGRNSSLKFSHSGQLPVTNFKEAEPSPGEAVSLNTVCAPPPSIDRSLEEVHPTGSMPFQFSKFKLVGSFWACDAIAKNARNAMNRLNFFITLFLIDINVMFAQFTLQTLQMQRLADKFQRQNYHLQSNI